MELIPHPWLASVSPMSLHWFSYGSPELLQCPSDGSPNGSTMASQSFPSPPFPSSGDWSPSCWITTTTHSSQEPRKPQNIKKWVRNNTKEKTHKQRIAPNNARLTYWKFRRNAAEILAVRAARTNTMRSRINVSVMNKQSFALPKCRAQRRHFEQHAKNRQQCAGEVNCRKTRKEQSSKTVK